MGGVNKNTRNVIFQRDEHACLRCGSKEDLTIDHVIPLASGGSNRKNNLQTLCYGCNRDKGNTTADYRRQEYHTIINRNSEPNKSTNPFSKPKGKKLKQVIKDLGFFDNPVTMHTEINKIVN